MAENLTPKKYIDSNNMKQILTAIKSKTPVGGEYVTEEQLLAKDYATKTYVGEQIANAEHLKREIVTVLPSEEEASDNVIYMLKVESATGNDKYQEYMKIDGTVQMVGDTSVDLTDYAKTTDIPTTLPANGGNANTVNNHTVKSDVPENAVFTDTIYDDTELKGSIEGLSSNLGEKVDYKVVVEDGTRYVEDVVTQDINTWLPNDNSSILINLKKMNGINYLNFQLLCNKKDSKNWSCIVNGAANEFWKIRYVDGVRYIDEIATMDKVNALHKGTTGYITGSLLGSVVKNANLYYQKFGDNRLVINGWVNIDAVSAKTPIFTLPNDWKANSNYLLPCYVDNSNVACACIIDIVTGTVKSYTPLPATSELRFCGEIYLI